MAGYTDQVRFQQLEQRVSDLEKETKENKVVAERMLSIVEKQQINSDNLLEIIKNISHKIQ